MYEARQKKITTSRTFSSIGKRSGQQSPNKTYIKSDVACYEGKDLLQFKAISDIAAYRRLYTPQINQTNTDIPLQSLDAKKRLYVSIDENEWEAVDPYKKNSGSPIHSITLPDKDNVSSINFYEEMANNGLSKEQNCDLCALHELEHLAQAQRNTDAGVTSRSKRMQTGTRFFSSKRYDKTINTLINLIPSGIPQNISAFLNERLKYIRDAILYDDFNGEAPAVLIELLSYTENISQLINFHTQLKRYYRHSKKTIL